MTKGPQLLEPGVGPSKLHLAVMKPIFKLKAQLTSQKSLAKQYADHRRWIIDTTRPLKEAQKQKRILISPTRAIEDSSRFWSIYMTLEHLATVEVGLTGIIKDLTHGKKPSTVVRTEDVKPSANAGPQAEKAFISLTSRSSRQLKELPVERGGETHVHPWFGPMTAHQWLTLRTVHLSVHIAQIKKILRELRS